MATATIHAQEYLAARFAGHLPPRPLPARYPVPASALPIPVQRQWQLQQQQRQAAAAVAVASGRRYETDDEDEDEDEEDGDAKENSSAIVIRINTGIRIMGQDNLLVLPLPPSSHCTKSQANNANDEEEEEETSSPTAENARYIAEAVMAAIRQGGEQEQGGIPMIDEEGRPRGITVQIEAGVEVRGKRNVVRFGLDGAQKGEREEGSWGKTSSSRKRRRENEDEAEGEGDGDRRRQRRRVEEVDNPETARLGGLRPRCTSI